MIKITIFIMIIFYLLNKRGELKARINDRNRD